MPSGCGLKWRFCLEIVGFEPDIPQKKCKISEKQIVAERLKKKIKEEKILLCISLRSLGTGFADKQQILLQQELCY